jgi:hypothetical protein
MENLYYYIYTTNCKGIMLLVVLYEQVYVCVWNKCFGQVANF